ncbi:MAG: polysaccharide pyruvyl transferase family protein [Kiritimatiellaeota bacterium]|nr:polysaccharide pyruvyl transferase family protein [Kiritimatiellota bacterium]
MRIAIITFQSALNYGAVLQTYALSAFLRQQGHEPKVIQYCPNAELTGKFKNRYRVFGLHPADYLNAYRQHAFKAFRERYIPQTERVYHTLDDLAELEAFDAYICGSDQVWNAELTGGQLDPAYFLSFAKAGAKRIAYAASTGGNGFQDEVRAAQLLENLTYLSVREASLVEPVARLSGKMVKPVLDPTLLPADYSPLIQKRRGRYILLYASQEVPGIYRRARDLAQMTGLPILNLGARVNPWKHPGRQICSSPAGYVSLFSQAEYVVTSSFHGTVFSTIFKRPFFSCALEGERAARNVRMVDFLENVGLRDRFFEADRVLKNDDLRAAQAVDWTAVSEKLHSLQQASVEFLQSSLSE